MKLLAIDPGFERLGIALIEKEKTGREKLIHSECFRTDPTLPFGQRLVLIGKKLEDIMHHFKPTALAIETLFMATNKKTGMHVAEARGVIMYECAKHNLAVFEYTPLQIKVAVTGYGKSDKKQVMAMVSKIIDIGKVATSDDELDAIAVGLTCIAYQKL